MTIAAPSATRAHVKPEKGSLMKKLLPVAALAALIAVAPSAAANGSVTVTPAGANVVIAGKATNVAGKIVAIDLFQHGTSVEGGTCKVMAGGKFTETLPKKDLRPGVYTIQLVEIKAGKPAHFIRFAFTYAG
jgi:hypothetical protein